MVGRESYRAPGQRGFSMAELMIVILAILVLAAVAVPNLVSLTKNLRMASDARTISGDMSLAKMRAASNFTRVRLYADLSANTYQIDVWQKSSSSWVTEGGTVRTLANVTLGYGSLTSPPTGTQSTLGQASACLDNSGTAIANTACIVFNSRGIAVDSSGAPTGSGAIYITNGAMVYGVTVSAMGLIQTWRTDVSSGSWSKV